MGVEAVFEGAAPGYKLKEAADAAEDVKRRGGGEEAMSVKRRSGWRRGGEEGRCGVDRGGGEEGVLQPSTWALRDYVYVKKTASIGQRRFRKYTKACRRLSFDRRRVRWVKPLEEIKTNFQQAGPADHLAYVLDQPPLAQHIYRLSDCSPPPRLCA